MTKPANIQDTTLFIPLFKSLIDNFDLEIQAVMADAAYDSESNLKSVINEMQALPRESPETYVGINFENLMSPLLVGESVLQALT